MTRRTRTTWNRRETEFCARRVFENHSRRAKPRKVEGVWFLRAPVHHFPAVKGPVSRRQVVTILTGPSRILPTWKPVPLSLPRPATLPSSSTASQQQKRGKLRIRPLSGPLSFCFLNTLAATGISSVSLQWYLFRFQRKILRGIVTHDFAIIDALTPCLAISLPIALNRDVSSFVSTFTLCLTRKHWN